MAKKLVWFVTLWVAGVVVVAGIAYGIKVMVLP